jgi:hypothetical protein
MKILYSRQSGASRLGCLFIVIIIALLWAGGQGIYTAVSNSSPTVMSYAQYVQTKPNSDWLKLTNCVLNLSEASYKSYAGSQRPTELFIPVQRRISDSGKVHVLLATKDEELISTFMEMQNLPRSTDIMEWASQNRDRIFPHRDVMGLVRFGIDMKEKERKKLAKMQESIAQDFIIVDDGGQPSLLQGLGLFGGGLALVFGFVFFQRRSGEVTATDI